MADTKLSAFASEAAPSVGDERLYIVTDMAGTPTSKYLKIGDVIYSSATAPSTPEANFLWHETDTGIIWRYGTYAGASRWVSAGLMAMVSTSGNAALSSDEVRSIGLCISAYDIYVERMDLIARVITANSGSNYWKFDLRYVSGTIAPAASAGTSLGAVDTSAMTVATWGTSTVAIGTTLSINNFPFIDVTSPGTPGAVRDGINVYYRLIHP